jgi:hypothetical protein
LREGDRGLSRPSGLIRPFEVALVRARRHGLFTRVAITERKQIQALLGEARKLLQMMK